MSLLYSISYNLNHYGKLIKLVLEVGIRSIQLEAHIFTEAHEHDISSHMTY